MFVLPLYYVPRFQQGGLIYKDNMYPQPVNLQGAAQSFGLARSQGYNEQMDNANLMYKGLQSDRQDTQLRLGLANQIQRQTQEAFLNDIRQKRLELENKRIESLNARELADMQFKFLEKGMFDVLPQHSERLQEALTRNNFFIPTNFNEAPDAIKGLQKLYRDSDFMDMLEAKRLYKEAYKGMDQVYEVMEKVKTDPSKRAFFDYEAMEDEVLEMNKHLNNFENKEDYLALRAKQINFGTQYTELGDRAIQAQIDKSEAEIALESAKTKQIMASLEVLQSGLEGLEDPKEIMEVYRDWKGLYDRDDLPSLSEKEAMVLGDIMDMYRDNPVKGFEEFYRIKKSNYNYYNSNYPSSVKTNSKNEIESGSYNDKVIDLNLIETWNDSRKENNKNDIMYFEKGTGNLVIQNAKENTDARDWLRARNIMDDEYDWLDRWADSKDFAKFEGNDLILTPQGEIINRSSFMNQSSGISGAPAEWATDEDPWLE